ncbi:MAG TPA: indole-3-glycerol phosphate synthase TrpC [Acidimicrobiia bacterium]|nr:indole-3-glycerol phosphate synthase TrpC [Acidimicrobiia bacterium]
MTVLDQILATKRDEVTMLRRPGVRDLLRGQALDAGPTRGFEAALRRDDGRLAVVAEIKRKSPSKGDLALDLDPAATARAYADGGAACLSVLTDAPWFGGAVADLHAARAAVDVPVLRKDFTIDEIQVFETRAVGADAILLIVAALPDDALLADLHALATELGLGVLVETHDDAELERALGAGARVVGVNARDLGTFDEDLGLSERLAKLVPPGVTAVAESAIRSTDDAVRMGDAGFDAVLVGEMLVRSSDPTSAVRELAAVTQRRGER